VAEVMEREYRKRHFAYCAAKRRSNLVKNRYNIYRTVRGFTRSHRRARRGASRPAFAQGGGGSGSDDDGSGDSDLPGPGARAYHLHPLTSHSKGNKLRYLNRHLSRRCWRVSQNTCGTQREGGRVV
jgi:hypothetical protein